MSGKEFSKYRKPAIGLFLAAALVAWLIYAGATAHGPAVAGPIRPEIGKGGIEQVILRGVLILGPVTTLLILEN